MSNFAFEPVSLPVSRAPSNESSQYQTSREATQSGAPSPSTSTMPTPPLTPFDSSQRDSQPEVSGPGLAKVHPDPVQMGPQMSGPKVNSSPASAATSRPSTPSDPSTRPTFVSQGSSVVEQQGKQESNFPLGPSEGSKTPRYTDSSHPRFGESSTIASPETSPAHGPEGGSGAVTPPYQRPFTPTGDRDDPYARSKRPPQSRNLDSIDKDSSLEMRGGDLVSI